MSIDDRDAAPQAPVQTTLAAIFFSMELSRSSWLITSLSPGGGEKMSKRSIPAGDMAGLMALLGQIREKVRLRTGESYPFVSIQEAGLDGFWIHRLLEREGVDSHVVDPASVTTSRRRRRAKTDRLDGETLLRTLLAYKRGDPRICAMVRPPSPEEEDRRRNCRERRVLIGERVRLVNRIKGLLFCHGIVDFQPLHKDRRARFDALRTPDGLPLPTHLRAELERMLDRVELLLEQVKANEATRDAMIAAAPRPPAPAGGAANLMMLKGVGPDFAEIVWSEGLYRHFDNRRQLAAYAGLAPTPWQSGSVSREQGVSQAGNPRLRTIMVQLSWFWLLHQPDSALTRWFRERTKAGGRSKPTIVAMARKLLIALWKFVHHGVVIEGAVMKRA
jgi:transposase